MRRHVDVLGHGLRLYGLMIVVISGLGAMLTAGLGLATGELAVAMLAPVPLATGVVVGAPFLLTGRGILAGRPWARTAGLILSALMLTDFPIGMSLGILGLGVLLDEEVTADFAAGRPPR